MNQNKIRLLAGGYEPYPERWFEHLQICDLVADKSTGAVAMVMSIQKQRHMNAPDYFRLDFADGSYMDVSDNELSAEYRPYLLVSRITTAPELLAVAQDCVLWYANRNPENDKLWPIENQPPEIQRAMIAIAKATGESHE